ncbi:hypothetical protein GCM10009733_047850 [Nonomuraea maheshkhaliensis]|uniref:Uncharacterized protein n=1 Tax=Nonomuraea maheshkhaliensis TaxID=419590 RepID=A0ABN2FFY9_9ACTN
MRGGETVGRTAPVTETGSDNGAGHRNGSGERGTRTSLVTETETETETEAASGEGRVYLSLMPGAVIDGGMSGAGPWAGRRCGVSARAWERRNGGGGGTGRVLKTPR